MENKLWFCDFCQIETFCTSVSICVDLFIQQDMFRQNKISYSYQEVNKDSQFYTSQGKMVEISVVIECIEGLFGECYRRGGSACEYSD